LVKHVILHENHSQYMKYLILYEKDCVDVFMNIFQKFGAIIVPL